MIATPPLHAGLPQFAAGILRGYRVRRARLALARETLRQLEELDEARRRDVGITRADLADAQFLARLVA